MWTTKTLQWSVSKRSTSLISWEKYFSRWIHKNNKLNHQGQRGYDRAFLPVNQALLTPTGELIKRPLLSEVLELQQRTMDFLNWVLNQESGAMQQAPLSMPSSALGSIQRSRLFEQCSQITMRFWAWLGQNFATQTGVELSLTSNRKIVKNLR